jgi:hypothetical protein
LINLGFLFSKENLVIQKNSTKSLKAIQQSKENSILKPLIQNNFSSVKTGTNTTTLR